jgi:putative solute:sodium symporter small subunit
MGERQAKQEQPDVLARSAVDSEYRASLPRHAEEDFDIMAEQPSQERLIAHWHKTRTLMLVCLAIWLFFSFIIHMFAPSLNDIRIIGFPLGFYMAAQGSLIAFVILIFWFARKQNRIDEEYDVHEVD